MSLFGSKREDYISLSRIAPRNGIIIPILVIKLEE